jgi:hypothetical protein
MITRSPGRTLVTAVPHLFHDANALLTENPAGRHTRYVALQDVQVDDSSPAEVGAGTAGALRLDADAEA